MPARKMFAIVARLKGTLIFEKAPLDVVDRRRHVDLIGAVMTDIVGTGSPRYLYFNVGQKVQIHAAFALKFAGQITRYLFRARRAASRNVPNRASRWITSAVGCADTSDCG